jgi:diguanylate cyclase (GGDEF)-like protein/PAS domain S-box-containing protein
VDDLAPLSVGAAAPQRLDRARVAAPPRPGAAVGIDALVGALRSLQQALARAADPASVFEAMLDQALTLTGSAFGFIGEVMPGPEGPYLCAHAITDIACDEAGRQRHRAALGHGMALHDRDSLFGWTIRTGETLLVNDPAGDPRAQGLPPEFPPLKSYLGIPIRTADDTVGLVGLANRPGGYDGSVVEALEPMVAIWASVVFAIRSERGRHETTDILEEALEAIPEGFSIFDRDDRLIVCNSAYKRMLPRAAPYMVPGIRFEDVVRLSAARVDPDAAAPDAGDWADFVAARLAAHRDPQGPMLYRTTQGQVLRIDEHRTARGNTVGMRTDVTELIAMQEERRRTEERFRSLYDLAPVGLVLTRPDGAIVEANPAFRALAGLDDGPARLVDMVAPAEAEAMAADLALAARDGGYGPVERTLRGPEGACITVLMQGRMLDGRDGERGLWTVVQDITERKRSEALVWRAAHHDGLTGLPNRTYLIGRIDALMAARADRGRRFGLILVDLDGFKLVNDTLGHEAGDELLKAVGDRLAQEVRPGDFVARLGGDEFAVILEQIDRPSDIDRVASRILARLAGTLRYDEQTIRPQGSLGIAVYPDHGHDGPTLLRAADVALYAAKRAGRNRAVFFESDMLRESARRFGGAAEGQRALDEGSIVPAYQPIVDLRSGVTVAFEALLRLKDAKAGFRRPDDLAAWFENPDLARGLDARMLSLVCDDLQLWLAAGLPIDHVSVNLSDAMPWRTGGGRLIRGELGRVGLAPERLRIEITENLFLGADPREAAVALEGLSAEGIVFSLDDFGTGHASISHLKSLPVAEVKIDRSFVKDVETDPKSRSIVDALVGLCHALGKVVVAEGIETEGQWAILTALGCDYGQGFRLGRPLAAADVPGHLLAAVNRRVETAPRAVPFRARR